MRLFLLTLALALGVVSPALSDQSDPRLEGLFRALRQSPDAAEAQPLEALILAAWLQSGSPSIDLLMKRGAAALEAQDFATARALFDAVTELKPDFAEGFYRRAEARLGAGDEAGARSDLEHVLALEPRHFAALFRLAVILEQRGEHQAALAALRRALALHPHLEAAKEKVRALEPKREGRGI